MRPTMRRWSWWLCVVIVGIVGRIVGMAAPGVQQMPASGLASGKAPRSASRPVQESTVVEVLGREHRNVLAFGRLYGVVRYFYPSDAAAGLEWDRFAVHGVKQVRAARDAAQLEAALEVLFEPLGPGIEIGATLSLSPAIGTPDDRLIAWRYLGAGFSGAVASPGRRGPYRGKRTRRPLAEGAGTDGFSRSATAPSAPSAQSRTPASADASAPASDPELFEGAVPVSGAHDDVDLGAGLKARVPLALSEEQAVEQAANAAKLNALRAALAAVKRPGTSVTGVVDDDTRLADVLITWNVFRHFYPYWTEADVDWDAQLEPHLQLARVAATRDVHRKVLRRLVAAARDGHGSVVDTWAGRDQRLRLPIRFGMLGRRVVVTASGVPADVPIGVVVSSIGGVSVVRTLLEETSLTSGSTQWKEVRALQALGVCAPGIESTDMVFSVIGVIGVIDGSRSTGATADSGAGPDRGAGANTGADAGTQVRSVRCEAPHLVPAEPRPPAITELAPAIWYVDLTRARMQQISPELEKLASAIGVVFDVRGYPTDAGLFILTHLLDAAEQDRWMHVRRITGPFGQSAGWNSLGWNLSPIEPRLTGKIVFLTDGRAISYAESVMGYIGDRKLATIVGSATAGTNGNVATFTLPGDFAISFTGMRVTGHDGEAQLHLIGVTPDILALPTIEGLRSGRDEVLERGVAAIHGR